MIKNKNHLNPALAKIVKLLAEVAVQDYMKKIEQEQEEREDGNQKN